MAGMKIPSTDYDSSAEAVSLWVGDAEGDASAVGPNNPLPTVSSSGARLPDGKVVDQVGTTMSRFVDGFNGNALNSEKWDVVRNTGGMTMTVTNGTLVVGMGTANGAELMLVGRHTVTIPANLVATFLMSQRLATNQVRFGYVEVDPVTGVPIPHSTPALGFRNYTAMMFASTTAGAATLESMSTDAPAVVSVVATVLAQTSLADHSLEVRPEDVTLSSQAANSVTARLATGARISSQVPNPERVYRPFLWLRNTGVSTATTVTFHRICSMDLQELQVEVGGGRGNTAPSQAMPVVLAAAGAATPVTVAATTLTNITATTTANGVLQAKVISAATTNATLVKTAVSKLLGGVLLNNGGANAYLKIYNKATAPVAGTDVPIAVFPLVPGVPLLLAGILDHYGMSTALGLGYALTGGPADGDATAVTAEQIVGTLLYV